MKKRHHAIVRITHWVNVVALTIMVGSGLRIFDAYPAFARRGETFCCYPFEDKQIPGNLTFGGWLAGRAQLALRDDVGARRERARLPRLRLYCTASGATSCRGAEWRATPGR